MNQYSFDPRTPEDDDLEHAFDSAYTSASGRVAPFHIGQRVTADPIACAYCDATAFEVGRGDYYTALRCVGCQREFCVHEG